MSMPVDRPFRWYREPVAWLGIAVLIGAIGGCISLIRTASQHVDADLPDPVDRRARMQVSAQRFSSTLPAQARLERQDGELHLQGSSASGAPATVQVLFWTTRAEHDVSVPMHRRPDGSYVGTVPTLPDMPMHVRVDTPSRDDALIGEWPALADATDLREPAR